MLEGRTLNERYKIRKMIGGGGMANVYLATDIILEREVAIKVLRLEYANDEEFIARFHREAQSATSLSHPNIVSIFDVGEEDGIYYMVMEYIDGMTLKKYIQTYGPIEVEEAIDIMKQITSAITHAHANEIVHRDIKPQNILIDPYGQVKVTDFGIAVALSATSLTQTNSVLGSVHYLSPEQARGGMATKKSDVYSLGIVLFELLSGRLPFSGQSAVSIALKHLQSNTPSIRRWNPNLPQSVENIVLKATSKDPFHRYEHVYEIEDDLNTALSPERINENPYSPPEDSGELTKAIPIITDDNLKQHNNLKEDTIVRSGNGNDLVNEKKKKKKKKLAIWITTSIVVLLGAIIAALFIIPSLLQPDEIEIPDVIELEYEEASDELRNLGLEVESESVYSEEIPEGYVVSSDPKAGITVIEGSEVLLFTSQGKQTIAFDDYVGQDFSQVQRLLQQSGYTVISNEQFSDQPEGEIIKQLHPQPGANVVPGETNVIFEVSRGRERVTLSQLVGMSVKDASDYLTREDLSVKVVDEQYSEEYEEGQVISQEPRALSEVEKGSVVEVVVSLGPEEKPPITHPVTVTVPYEPAQQDGEDTQQDPQGQEIIIYVTDMNRNDEIVRQVTIMEQTDFTLSLTIQPNGNAEYRVMRDGNVFESETISYEDVAGD
ncbi:Stk1 family PASTA domain-containing Ser/Thr kinase [Radiobacillus sp. PE A8.2]|uniref:Stk1 family PASTA domain-containing Ser/Thr kinase n=1 Tax=Radiobacillus sp. PE A8.2 TaxID=3380349 RepID=UPI00388D0CB5